MKYILYLIITIVLLSCKPQKQVTQVSKNSSSFSIENNLTEVESSIINDFMDVELKDDLYKNYRELQYIIIEESFKKKKSIEAYLYSEKEWLPISKKLTRKEVEKVFFLDSLQTQKIKLELKNEEEYHWKVSDFKNIKVNLLKREELRKMIQTNTLFNDSARLVFYLLKPLIIDRNHAFLSYEIDKCNYICINMTHFTVLMKMEKGLKINIMRMGFIIKSLQ
jgi:hypothetical protein